MTNGFRPAVLIPVFDHGATLRGVVVDALAFLPGVIVVDDGSRDGGPDTLADLPVVLLRHATNQGKGAALRSGAARARELGFTHVITMDADEQHKASDIPSFLREAERHPDAVIVGARDFTVPNVPASSRFGRRFSRFWMFLQTGADVSDMQSGFRCYPLSVLENVHGTENRYSFEIEILVRAVWAGFDVREIPVQVEYLPKGRRVSHFRALSDNVRISLLNTRLTVRALMPVPFRRTALGGEAGLSLRHPLASLKRLLLMRETPAGLARTAAWSAFISTLPLLGLQSMILLYAVNRLKLCRLCALLVVPLTWPPLVPGLAVLAGYRIINGCWLTEFSVRTLGYEAGRRFIDWAAGSIVVAPAAAAIAGCAVYLAASACRHVLEACSDVVQ